MTHSPFGSSTGSPPEPVTAASPQSHERAPRGRRRFWLVAICGLAVVSALSWWVGSRAQSPSQAAARAAEPSASWVTARVERRVLASTVVLRGDVRPEVSLAAVVASTGPTVAQGEMVFIPTAPARVQSAVTSLGPIGAPAAAGSAPGVDASSLVTLAAGDLVVSTAVRAGDEGLVRVGMPVELLDETTNTKYPGKLSTIADTPPSDASGTLSRAATVVPDTPLPASLAGTNLRVTITAAASDGEVLVVPLSAVSSTAAGATRVSVLEPGTANPVDVPVTAGISADGFVAITPTDPAGLKAGDLVVVGR